MLLYVTFGTNDLYRARHFYDAVLPVLGYRCQRYSEEEIGYAADGDTRCRFWVVTPFNRRRDERQRLHGGFRGGDAVGGGCFPCGSNCGRCYR